MISRLTKLATFVLCLTLTIGTLDVAQAASPDALKVELAAPPSLLTSGPEAGNWEYIYDVIGDGTEGQFVDWSLNGFDTSLIVNHKPDDPLKMTQKWSPYAANNPSVGNRLHFGSYSPDNTNWLLDGHAGEILNGWHAPYEYMGVGGGFHLPRFIADGVISGDGVGSPYTLYFNAGITASNLLDGLLMSVRVVHPYAPGTIGFNLYSFNGGGTNYIGDVVGPGTAIACLVGDANCDSYVDVGGDILPAFSNFTGPGSFGKTRLQGDVHGPSAATTDPDGHDGDVDVQDLLTMFSEFTGPPTDNGAADEAGGLAAAEAGDANIPDLIYDAATGEVTLDVDGSGIIGYVLKNGDNSFAFGNHTQMLAGVKTSVAGELSEAAFASSVGANSIGNVFPTGMNLAALTAYLTVNDVSRSLGAPVVPFDLIVLSTGPVVPEPATLLLGGFGFLCLGLIAGRRRS